MSKNMIGNDLNSINSYHYKIGMFLHFKYPATKARNKIMGAKKAFKGYNIKISIDLKYPLE